MTGKYDDGEWTDAVVFAEVKEHGAAMSGFDAEHFAGNTLRFADVLSRLHKRNAVR